MSYNHKIQTIMLLVSALFLAGYAQQQDHPAENPEIVRLIESAISRQLMDTTAFSYYEHALQVALETTDTLSAAAVFNQIGLYYHETGEYQRALGAFESGLLLISQQADNAIAKNPANPLLATDLRITDDIGSTQKGYSAGTALPIQLHFPAITEPARFFDRNSDSIRVELGAMLMCNAGNMYLKQSQFSQADMLYRRAEKLTRQTGDETAYRLMLTNRAWVPLHRGEPDSARALLDAALAAMPGGELPVEMRLALLTRGVLHRQMGQFPAAIQDIRAVVDRFRQAGDVRGLCRALAHLGSAYYESGDLESARQTYEKALQHNAGIADKETTWHASGGLANVYERLGNDEQSLVYFEQYWQIIQQLGGGFSTDQGRVSFLESQDALLRTYAKVILNVAADRQNFAIARPVIEKLRGQFLAALQEPIRRRKPASPGVLPASYVLFQNQTHRWMEFYDMDKLSQTFSGDGSHARMMEQIAVGIPTNQVAPGILSDTSPPEYPFDHGADSSPLPSEPSSSPADLPKATFLEYFILQKQVAVIVKTASDRIYGALLPVTEDSLSALVDEYRVALNVQRPSGLRATRNLEVLYLNPPRSNVRPAASISLQLHQLLIAPVAKHLPRDTQQTVVIVPYRALWLLPFAALQDEQNRYFGDRHLLTYASSYADWAFTGKSQRDADHRSARAWVVGNPRMPDSLQACNLTLAFSQLPGAESEAQAIAALFAPGKAEVFTGADADRLRLEAWYRDFSVLHFATHGFACVDDPLSSFIVLSEHRQGSLLQESGALSLSVKNDPRLVVTLDTTTGEYNYRRVMQDCESHAYFPGMLDARTIISRFNLNADLVTLSACQTGLGKLTGQGMIGFSRAFLAAGARSLLVSLWKVDDAATKDLMVAFYREYLRHGNKARALRSATQTIRGKYPDPKHWAAFTLIGMAE